MDLPKWEFIFLITIYVTEMWTTATTVPKQGCPLLVLDKVLQSEDSETLDWVCKVLPIKEKVARRVKIVFFRMVLNVLIKLMSLTLCLSLFLSS